MKKFILLQLVALMVVTFSSGLYAAEAKNAKGKKIVIGISLPTQREERWVRDKETMIAAAKKLGVELKVQVADADVSMQNSQVENLLSQGIDVLILAPHDASAAATLVEKAHAEGVKVISYDRLIMNTDLDVYLSFDNVKVGELQGEYFTKNVKKGNIIVMAGAPTDNNAKLFKKGAMKYIQPLIDKGVYKVIADQAVDNWEPQNALKIVENGLTKAGNKIDGILAPNDGTAGGAVEALSAQGMAGKVIVTGQDAEKAASKRIAQGTQSMTIFKDTRKLGQTAIELAINMAQGKAVKTNGQVVNNNKMDVPSVLLTPQIIDKNSIQDLVKAGYLKAEDLK